MCSGGSSSNDSATQEAIANSQNLVAQQTAAAQLAEQQREFDIQTQENAQTLANTQAQEAANQAQVDQQAALTEQWQTGRAAEQQQATDSVNQAFAQFTPDYYANFTKAYTDHYDPQVEQQYAAASNQTDYGLARTGNLQSQTAADQFGNLAEQNSQALSDINNQAIGATTTLQNNVLNAKQNLMSQATSDATLGSPNTPGSADAITADFNNTSAALSGLNNTAADTVTTLQATPAYSSLGSLFGSAASSGAAAQTGLNNYNVGQAYNAAAANAANPTSSSSGQVAP